MTESSAEIPIDELLHHTTWVRQLAFSLTRDPNEADELIQETWLRVLRSPPRPGVPLRAWLSRVLHNTASNQHRSAARRAAREKSMHGARTVPSVTETLERADLHAFLVNAMQDLPAPDRALIAMRYLEDQPPRALAVQLNLTVDTVRKRLQRARAQLRDRLQKHYGSDWRESCLAFACLSTGSPGLLGLLLAAAQHKIAVATLLLITGGLSWWAFEQFTAENLSVEAPTTLVTATAKHDADPLRYRASAPTPVDNRSPTGSRTTAQPSPAAQAPAFVAPRSPGDSSRQSQGPASASPDGRKVGPYRNDSTLAQLNRLARVWFAAWKEHSDATRIKDRIRLGKSKRRHREAFDRAWAKASVHRDLLGDQRALETIFYQVFPYAKQRAKRGAVVRSQNTELNHALFVPAGYDPKHSYGMVLHLPARRASDSQWTDPADWLKRTWSKSARRRKTIAVAPSLSASLDLDSPVTTDIAAERERLKAALIPAGDVQRAFRIDRNRFVLDCGRRTTAFGIRLATYFPTRFAGLVLRWPQYPENLRLDSLLNLPVLLVRSRANWNECDKLHAEIERIGGRSTVIDARENPSEQSRVIDKWIATRRRNLMPKTVVIAPNHDQYHNAYWVAMGTATPLAEAGPHERPYLRVHADRETNTITIETRGVQDFRLLLNDSLVDVAKFQVIVNGRSEVVEKRPSLRFLASQIQGTYDTNRLFTAEYSATVPRLEGQEGR